MVSTSVCPFFLWLNLIQPSGFSLKSLLSIPISDRSEWGTAFTKILYMMANLSKFLKSHSLQTTILIIMSWWQPGIKPKWCYKDQLLPSPLRFLHLRKQGMNTMCEMIHFGKAFGFPVPVCFDLVLCFHITTAFSQSFPLLLSTWSSSVLVMSHMLPRFHHLLKSGFIVFFLLSW